MSEPQYLTALQQLILLNMWLWLLVVLGAMRTWYIVKNWYYPKREKRYSIYNDVLSPVIMGLVLSGFITSVFFVAGYLIKVAG